jgi:hypothetical protein
LGRTCGKEEENGGEGGGAGRGMLQEVSQLRVRGVAAFVCQKVTNDVNHVFGENSQILAHNHPILSTKHLVPS